MLSRFDRLLVASLAAHALALAAVAIWAPRRSEPMPVSSIETQPYEVSLEPVEAPTLPQEGQHDSPAQGIPMRAPGAVALRVDVSGTGGIVPFPVGSATEPTPGSPLQGGPESTGQQPGAQGPGAGRSVDLGLGQGAFWPRWEGNRPPAPRAASTSGGLREAMQEHDTAIGMGPGGPVVSAARTAAQPSTAMGVATFTVTCNAQGRVVSVRVADASRDMREWTLVADSMASSLRSAVFRVPAGANGLMIAVRIEASKRLPSGARAGPSVAPKGLGLGGEFDLSDIGQKPQRVVSTAIVSERAI
ncbi:MAG: hypothetical protein HY898_28835 [Deltaproteobacteria bacterium]|nr:hypothetical protein [Deltaproteobacteria bacterium]